MGSKEYKAMLKERKENFEYLKKELVEFAEKNDEKVLDTPHNSISIGKKNQLNLLQKRREFINAIYRFKFGKCW